MVEAGESDKEKQSFGFKKKQRLGRELRFEQCFWVEELTIIRFFCFGVFLVGVVSSFERWGWDKVGVGRRVVGMQRWGGRGKRASRAWTAGFIQGWCFVIQVFRVLSSIRFVSWIRRKIEKDKKVGSERICSVFRASSWLWQVVFNGRDKRVVCRGRRVQGWGKFFFVRILKEQRVVVGGLGEGVLFCILD